MKKFLAFMCVLLVVLSFGLLTVYLLKDDEDLKLNVSEIYYNKGEQITVNFEIKNKKQSTKLYLTSSNPAIVEITSDNKIIAKAGGEAVVTGILKNASKEIKRTVSHLVKIGDGAKETPFYIRTEEELAGIGRKDNKFTLDKNYLQTRNITLTKEWNTIAGTFNGVYNGEGHEINKLKVSGVKKYTSIFETLSSIAKVGYLTFNEVDIKGEFENASVVAFTNHGTIDNIVVNGNIVNENKDGQNAGIAIRNIYDPNYTTNTVEESIKPATISRCTNKLKITINDGFVGGIAAYNNSILYVNINGGQDNDEGTITYKNASTKAIAGGIVAVNEFNKAWTSNFKKFTAKKPIVADSYSIGKIVIAKDPVTGEEPLGFVSTFVGGIVGKNINGTTINESDFEGKTNYVFGNYYVVNGTIAGAISPQKLYDRGIGNGLIDGINGKYSTKEIVGGDQTSIDYIAAGVTNDMLIDKSGLVSFVKNGDTKHWSNNIWGFYKSNYPILLETTTFDFVKFNIDLPILFLPGGIIENETQFNNIAFNEQAYSGVNSYVVKNDLDFSKIPDLFFASKANVISNLQGAKNEKTGEYPVIKNLTISTINSINKTFYGMFANAKNITISNLNFENLKVKIPNGETSIVDIGMLIGNAENCEIKNVSIKNGELLTSEKATNVGGFVGNANNVQISNCEISEMVISVESKAEARIGGFVGKMQNSNITSSKIEVEIAAGGEDNYAGAISGSLISGKISKCQITAEIEARFAAGVSGVVTNGTIEQVETNTVIKGVTQSAGCSIVASGASQFIDSKFTTKFGSGTGANVGFISQFKDSGKAQKIIILNTFAAGSDNYSKTMNKPKLNFTGANVNRNYNSDSTTEMLNCFYRDSYGEGIKEAKAHLIMEKDNGFLGMFGDDWRANKKKVPDIDYGGRFNTAYGTGRLQENGSLVTSPKGRDYKYFGFSSNWNLGGMPSIIFINIGNIK